MVNIVKYDEETDTLQISQYVSIGEGWLVLRKGLPDDHPNSYYQEIKKLGFEPESFGVHFKVKTGLGGYPIYVCPCCGKDRDSCLCKCSMAKDDDYKK